MEPPTPTSLATILLSSDLAGQCNTKERLLTTAIGLRKIRASSRLVRDAANFTKSQRTQKSRVFVPLISRSDNVKFTVVGEDGVERRMTKSEKKEARARIRENKKQASQCCAQRSEVASTSKANEGKDDRRNASAYDEEFHNSSFFQNSDQNEKYYNFGIHHKRLEEEIEDLQFERKGTKSVPAMLSAAMSYQAFRIGLFKDLNRIGHIEDNQVLVDDDLGSLIAASIKEEILQAEQLRSKENMRSLAYRLVPEVWTRLRPKKTRKKDINEVKRFVSEQSQSNLNINEIENDSERSSRPWVYASMSGDFERQQQHSFVIQALLDLDNIHVSCGSKFGCDFLLYDGNREDRHAFAGMRVVLGTTNLPCPYDLAGMVRGLNTAGKLALLCFVSSEETPRKIAFIDLALEKILTAPTHRKRSRIEKRKEVGKNLSKRQKELDSTELIE